MKKYIGLLLAFLIVWALTAFMCYLLTHLFGGDWFANDWREYAVIGFSGAMAGLFGPVLAAWIGRIFKKKA